MGQIRRAAWEFLMYHLDVSVVNTPWGILFVLWERWAFQCVFASCVVYPCDCNPVCDPVSCVVSRCCRLEEACMWIVQSWSQEEGTKE